MSETVIPAWLLTRRQAAAALAISLRSLDTRISEGVFPIVKIGSSTRLNAEMLRRWIEEHEKKKVTGESEIPGTGLTNRPA